MAKTFGSDEEKREYQREIKRRQRARQRGEKAAKEAPSRAAKVAEVTPIRGLPPMKPDESLESEGVETSVVTAVLAELARLPLAQHREATVASALAMARLLDDQAWKSLHPQANRQLDLLMEKLRVGEARESSPLTQLRAARSAR